MDGVQEHNDVDLSSKHTQQPPAALHKKTPKKGVRYKGKPRSEELKRDLNTRCNRVIGQLNGIKSMVDNDRYCGDILTQLAAAESAIKSISRELMQDHLNTCVVDDIQQGNVEVLDEVMRLFKKFM
ncbi:MAG: metal-sensing transcriptional repressor [Atopobiaceae bacterium]|jgi:DNA-binding FrmR family transcriptional regulator